MIPSTYLAFLMVLFHFGAGYDNFEGAFVLSRPCFPAYEHIECNSTLCDVYKPLVDTGGSNEPVTKFYLFTPSSPDMAEQLHLCGGGLPPNSTFDASCPTVLLTHGFGDGLCRSGWMREMKEQFFQKSKCYNVILTDWTWGCSFDPMLSGKNTEVVGKQIAFVLKTIAQQTNYDCHKFHVIGQSFGASASSFAGKNMKNECRLGRLTGLDPPLPSFKYVPSELRFNHNDALFVDSYHTNGGSCFPPNFGDIRPSGHVDFYFNDGTQQPSCRPYILTSLLKLDVFYALVTLIPTLCYHSEVIQYFKASIQAEADNSYLIGVRCNSYKDLVSGRCERNCDIQDQCLPVGLDLPKFLNTTNLGSSEEEGRIYFVPTSLSCPYTDYTGFKGLPLKPIESCGQTK